MRPTDAAPPRPVMAFQVGVTGHRALPGADPGLQSEAARLFRAIGSEVVRLHAADQAGAAPLYRADPPALRCVCGIAEGADSVLAEAALAEGWALVAVLPFAREEFARDFEGPALARYRALLGRAAVVSELDGSRGRGGEPYAHIGQQIVEQSDLMLVVWDGQPPRGPGGTGDVVQQGLERGLPVGVLPPVGPAVVDWRGSAALPALLQAALLPPPDAGGYPQAYFSEGSGGASWARAAVRWFEGAILVGRSRPEVATPGVAEQGRVDRLGPYFSAADRLAGDYAARYRAAGLMRYALVLPATVGSFIASFGDPWLKPFGYVMQFGSLAAVVAFSTRGGWERSQGRFVAYRALAEYLRNAGLLAPLGAVAQAPGAAAHEAPASDWTAWYGRAVVRGVGLMPGRLDEAAVAACAAELRARVMEEIGYLAGRAARFGTIARRLKRIGLVLVVAGIGFTVLHAALLFVAGGTRPVLWSNQLALVLPALAPVFLGLLGFGEYARLATRYRAVAAELETQLAALDRAGPGRAGTLRVARRVAEVMLAEAADWRLLIKARGLSAY